MASEQTTQPVEPGQRLSFLYKNWRGETSHRSVYFHGVEWGATPWHSEPQWLLRALDIEKQEIRLFAMRDMGKVAYD